MLPGTRPPLLPPPPPPPPPHVLSLCDQHGNLSPPRSLCREWDRRRSAPRAPHPHSSRIIKERGHRAEGIPLRGETPIFFRAWGLPWFCHRLNTGGSAIRTSIRTLLGSNLL